MLKSTAILPLCALVALAACSSGSSSSSSTTVESSSAPAAATTAAAGDACALVTQAEATTALGSAAQAGIAKTDHDGYTSCRYYDATKTKNVFVQFLDPKLADNMTMMGGKEVAGVGDKATWLSGSIFFQKSGKAAQVGLYLSPASMQTMDPGEVDLAKTAAGRM